MNSSINNTENIREYLLGRVANDSLLSQIEELLFLNTDFFDAVELEQEELINDYVFGRLSESDRNDFEKTLSSNKQRKLEVELAYGLKEKAKQAIPAEPVKKPGFLESIRESFKQPAYGRGVAVLQPAYIGAFAVLLIAIAALAYVFLPRQSSGDLAELRSMYKDQRQTEARISGFDYAQMRIVRGGDKSEEEDAKTAEIKARLLSKKSYHALGVFYLNQKNFPEAIKKLNLALQSGPESADLHNDLGTAYFELGTSGPAEKKLETVGRALDEFTKALQLNPEKLEALFNRSLALQALEQTEQARESWKQYLQKDPSSKWAEEARTNLGTLDRGQSGLKTKESVLEDFLAAYRKKDDETAWKINSQTRNAVFGIWLPDQLSRRYVKAKLKADAAEEKESLDSLTYIGNLEKQKNADFFVSDLAAELSRVNDTGAKKLSAAQAAFDGGLVQFQSSNNTEALKSLETSEALFLQAGNPLGETLAQYWIMYVLKGQVRNREARQKSDELLKFTRAKNYKWLEASTLYFTGTIFFAQSGLSKAMDSYLMSLESAKRLDDTLLIQRNRITIVERLIETGEYRKALVYRVGGAEDLYYNGGAAAVWRDNYFSGRLLLKLGLYSAAEEFARESLAAAKSGEPPLNDSVISSLALLAQVKTAKHQADEALAFAGESLALLEKQPDDLNKPTKLAAITLRIADLKRELGRCEESVADFQKVIALFKDSEYSVDSYAAHKGLLLCLKDLDRPAEVTAELENVLSLADDYRDEIMEDESRQAFFDNEQAVFDIAIGSSLSNGDGLGAFHRAERSKARSLLDMIGKPGSIDRLEKTIYKESEPLSADDIRAKMPANSQIVEYALLEDRLAVWIISKDGVQTVDLKIDAGDLNSKIEDLARMDRDRNSPANRRGQTAAELFRALIAPLSTFLDPSKTLVIIPDKSLYYVPFASLVTGENKFMIEQFTISYSPSSTIFVSNSEKGAEGGDRKAERLLSVGDPDFSREEFPGLRKLDMAKTEAREIAAMMPNSQVIAGKDATKKAFMSAIEKAQVVHFAGHYVANQDTPSRSKLVFAGSGGEEGGLRISDIAEKKLPGLKLVVLSACESGIENVIRGEGSISASRAFLAAGAPVVVASQWSVDNEATGKLMIAFHRNRQQGLNSAAALKSAQLEMINNPAGPFALPYYWAAFGVTGGLEN
jgi:CHAT domain-containing protein/lipoprotein NlpI